MTVPAVPIARDEMDAAAFHGMLEKGMSQAKAGQGMALDDAFAALERDV